MPPAGGSRGALQQRQPTEAAPPFDSGMRRRKRKLNQGAAVLPMCPSPLAAAAEAEPDGDTTTLRLVLSMACFVARARRGGAVGSVAATAPAELTGEDDVLADSREELEGLMGDPETDLPPSLQPKFEEACRLLKVRVYVRV